MSQAHDSEGPPKVPIPRIQTRRHQQLPRRANQQHRDRVLIACNTCRGRKMRCDGAQPQCRSCLESGQPCVYLDTRRNRFRTATKQNRDMINLLKQLKDSATDEAKHQIVEMLDSVEDDVSEATATFGLEQSSEPDDTYGESVVSADVGSNDETDVLDEDILQDKETQATGYIGKSSEVQWLRRLQQEAERREVTPSTPSSQYGPPGSSSESTKLRIEALKQRQHEKPNVPTSASTFYLDGEGVEVDCSVEPYKLPTIEVAQRLLDRYMQTVHDTFPILSKETFTDQVRHYYASIAQGAPFYVPEKWLARMNLVFAIGARFSYLTGADWHEDSRDHIIYQSRAHMLNLDESTLVYQPDFMRVQITALFAFYSSTVGNVNRAWVAIGIALRYALALGLHLRNEDDTIKTTKKETLVHVWWALQILEGSLSTMLGRPSIIFEEHYSTPLPLPVAIEQLAADESEESSASYWANQYKEAGPYNSNARNAATILPPSNTGSLLRCMAEISIIGQRAMTGVYSARVAIKSWKNMQGTIAGLCGELESWLTTLPPDLNFTLPNTSGHFMRERQILHMNFIRTKILITRPCLCRLDSRIPNQSKVSDVFNKEMARTCVDAARTFTDILPDITNVAQCVQAGPWWSLVHHIMQALTVLLLEMSYGTVHMPDSGDILPRVKVLIRWLRTLQEKDRVAVRAYDVAFGILQNLACRLQEDVSDLMQEDASMSGTGTSQSQFVTEPYGQFDYDEDMSHSSLFASQPPLSQGDPQVPAFGVTFGTSPQRVTVSGSSSSNPFGTAHDEQNPFLFDS